MSENLVVSTEAKIHDYILGQYPGISARRLGYEDSLAGVLDSLAVLGVIGFIEPEFGIELNPSDVTDENFSSIAAISRLVSRLTGRAA